MSETYAATSRGRCHGIHAPRRSGKEQLLLITHPTEPEHTTPWPESCQGALPPGMRVPTSAITAHEDEPTPDLRIELANSCILASTRHHQATVAELRHSSSAPATASEPGAALPSDDDTPAEEHRGPRAAAA